jgi:uncharacterized membrane protein
MPALKHSDSRPPVQSPVAPTDEFTPFGPALIFPRNSGERINLMIHFHRAEMGRMTSWRDRIDRTTNWAITVVAASLSFSFSSPSISHVTLIACLLMVHVLLFIESRRYRFFDVYRFRVRLLEQNYYANMMSPNPRADEHWLERLGEDLRNPTFKVGLSGALKRRLRRNYIWLLSIVVLAWILKVCLLADAIPGEGDLFSGRLFKVAAIGPINGKLVMSGILAWYAWLCIFSRMPGRPEHLPRGGVNV